MKLNILVLPGDGIGPEITAEAVKVLKVVADAYGHELNMTEGLIGGASLDATGEPITAETLKAANEAGAVLMGAVGTPKYDDAPPAKRPEKAAASPLKEGRINGTDMLILRELTGGLYFGTPRGVEGEGKERHGFNTMTYSYAEIERITRMAFELARKRRKHVTSVDKANVLETSQLWRSVVVEIAKDYPDVTLDHLYVDNAAMQLILRPSFFDVMLTENLFGDIISDEAAVIGGSIGLLPSGSLGAPRADGTLPGLYEPIHGSAPDIAGKGIANPLGTIGSVAVMLDWSFGLKKEAQAIYDAIDQIIAEGPTTPDLLGGTGTTKSVGDAVAKRVAELSKK
jgi:3-isopropylmalate dehydrogenase